MGTSFSDIFLAVFNPAGSHISSASFGDASLDYAGTLAIDPSNDILVSGRFQGTANFGGGLLVGAGDDDAFLVKFGAVPAGIATPFSRHLSIGARPNPFNPATTIDYQLPEAGHATLGIYHVSGRRVKTLVNETRPAGRHEVRWDGRDERGAALSSGVYFARLAFGRGMQTRKIVLLK
jgi:hypothetical protein